MVLSVSQVVLHMFAFIAISFQTPFIFDDSVKYCQYFLDGHTDKYFETTSKSYLVKAYQMIEIWFKLCELFDAKDHCPKGTVACLEHQKTAEKYHFGTSFILDGDNLRSINGSACSGNKTYSLVVHMRSKNKTPSFSHTEDKCSYHVEMMHQEHSNRCGIEIYGRFLDLSAIARTYNVQINDSSSKANKNFSVTLCGENASCGQTDISSCEITEQDKWPISTSSSQSIAYDGEKIVIRGSIRGPRNSIVKRLEVFLICDWEKTEVQNNDLTYVLKSTQGRKYTFNLETSYGCLKKPASCIVRDNFFIYNLSKLYTERIAPWAVDGKPVRNNSIYFLQVCGPIQLVGKNDSCKDTYAQVCENVNGIDINRGSVFSNLELSDGVLRGTIDSGARCQEKPHLRYRTVIDFICVNNDDKAGPKLESYGNCDTRFTWRTPEACPQYDPATCSYLHVDKHDCFFEDGINYYNLSAIAETKVIKDPKTPKLQFKLNICHPVVDSDSPCNKDVSVIMKNLSEPNIRYSIISLGKFQESSVINSSLLLQYGTGGYCDEGDYRSEVLFDCSDSEEIFIAKQEKCYFQFVWKTKYGCPKPVDSDKFRDIRNCSSIDANINVGLIPPLKFHTEKYAVTIFICGGFYSNCTLNKDECANNWFEGKKASFSRSNNSIELNRNEICSSPDDFNKVTVNFLCDEFENNGHFENFDLTDCHVVVDYVTNVACVSQKTSNSTEHPESLSILPKEEKLIDVSTAHPVENIIDCSIKSPFTNRILNISNLNNPFFKQICPFPTFNDTFRFVRLLYNSTDVCRPMPTRNVSYEVYLMCANDVNLPPKSPVEDEECRQHYSYEQKEYCNFFTPRRKSYVGTVIGTLAACLLTFGGLLCILFSVRKRRMCCFRQPEGFSNIYERDTQL